MRQRARNLLIVLACAAAAVLTLQHARSAKANYPVCIGEICRPVRMTPTQAKVFQQMLKGY